MGQTKNSSILCISWPLEVMGQKNTNLADIYFLPKSLHFLWKKTINLEYSSMWVIRIFWTQFKCAFFGIRTWFWRPIFTCLIFFFFREVQYLCDFWYVYVQIVSEARGMKCIIHLTTYADFCGQESNLYDWNVSWKLHDPNLLKVSKYIFIILKDTFTEALFYFISLAKAIWQNFCGKKLCYRRNPVPTWHAGMNELTLRDLIFKYLDVLHRICIGIFKVKLVTKPNCEGWR